MNEGVSMTQTKDGALQCGVVLSLVISGAVLIRMGYNLGLRHAKDLMKQHSKDVRIMNKREKQIFKEQRKKEKEERRRNEGRTGWLWFTQRPTSSGEGT